MKRSRTLTLSALAAGMLAAMPALAETKATIHVTLQDNPDMAMETDLGYGMGGDMSKASMGIKLDRDSVASGEITFVGTNGSKDFEHEMIVAPLPADGSPLPYLTADGGVDEDAARALGEIAETEPGASGQLTLHLDPGKYILFCNVPGHYMDGMWTVLTVN